MRVAPSRRRCLAALLAGAAAAACAPRIAAGATGDADRLLRLERKVTNLEREIGNLETELTAFEWVSGFAALLGTAVWVFVFRRQNSNEKKIKEFESKYEDHVLNALEAAKSTLDRLRRVANRISDEERLLEFKEISKTEWPNAHEKLAEKLKDLDASSTDPSRKWLEIIGKYTDAIADVIENLPNDPSNAKKVAASVESIEDAARNMSVDINTALTAHKDSLRNLWNWRRLRNRR